MHHTRTESLAKLLSDSKNENVEDALLMGQAEDSLARFEVSVHDAVAVDVLQSQDSLSNIQAGHVHRKTLVLSDQGGIIPN